MECPTHTLSLDDLHCTATSHYRLPDRWEESLRPGIGVTQFGSIERQNTAVHQLAVFLRTHLHWLDAAVERGRHYYLSEKTVCHWQGDDETGFSVSFNPDRTILVKRHHECEYLGGGYCKGYYTGLMLRFDDQNTFVGTVAAAQGRQYLGHQQSPQLAAREVKLLRRVCELTQEGAEGLLVPYYWTYRRGCKSWDQVQLLHGQALREDVSPLEPAQKLIIAAPRYDQTLADFCGYGPVVDRLRILAKAVTGLLHLHQARIAHLDVKAANILCSRDRNGKLDAVLSDYGCAVELDDRTQDWTTSSTLYMSPDLQPMMLQRRQSQDNIAVSDRSLLPDLFSLGKSMQEDVFSPNELEDHPELAELISLITSENAGGNCALLNSREPAWMATQRVLDWIEALIALMEEEEDDQASERPERMEIVWLESGYIESRRLQPERESSHYDQSIGLRAPQLEPAAVGSGSTVEQ